MALQRACLLLGIWEGQTANGNPIANPGITVDNNSCQHAEGELSKATGRSSHAEGYSTTASGTFSHAEGCSTTASGAYSHAEGYSTTASGASSHAEGYSTTASGASSHAGGSYTKAQGSYSFAHGSGVTANGTNTVVFGSSYTVTGDNIFAYGIDSNEYGFLYRKANGMLINKNGTTGPALIENESNVILRREVESRFVQRGNGTHANELWNSIKTKITKTFLVGILRGVGLEYHPFTNQTSSVTWSNIFKMTLGSDTNSVLCVSFIAVHYGSGNNNIFQLVNARVRREDANKNPSVTLTYSNLGNNPSMSNIGWGYSNPTGGVYEFRAQFPAYTQMKIYVFNYYNPNGSIVWETSRGDAGAPTTQGTKY